MLDHDRKIGTIAGLALIAGLAMATAAGAASLQTVALVELVPPVEAALAAPISATGDTVWRIDNAAATTWHVTLETRDLDGRLLETRSTVPGDSPLGDKELATFGAPSIAPESTPLVLNLVLCRE